MRSLDSRASLLALVCSFLCVAAVPWPRSVQATETEDAVTIAVEDLSAKVGQRATLVARVTPKEGYTIADAYRNRITKLSAADDGVELSDKPVRGVMQDGGLVFRIPLTVTKPGAHAINGVIRFAFVNALDQDRHLDIKWAPLIATVTGTE
jgi:hypothetical protein